MAIYGEPRVVLSTTEPPRETQIIVGRKCHEEYVREIRKKKVNPASRAVTNKSAPIFPNRGPLLSTECALSCMGPKHPTTMRWFASFATRAWHALSTRPYQWAALRVASCRNTPGYCNNRHLPHTGVLGAFSHVHPYTEMSDLGTPLPFLLGWLEQSNTCIAVGRPWLRRFGAKKNHGRNHQEPPMATLTTELCARLRQIDMGYYASGRPGRFSATFTRHTGQTLPWSDVVRLYLEAQASRYVPHEILWIENVRTTHDHLIWFGALAPDGASLGEMMRTFQEIVGREGHLHELWDSIESRDLERSASTMVYSWSAPSRAFSGEKTMSHPDTKPP